MITVKGDKLVVCFKYDPALVAAVRAIPGRSYDNGAKHWEVPIAHIADVMWVADRFKLRVHRDVALLAAERAHEVRRIEALKAEPAPYAGTLPLYDYQKIGAGFMMALPGSLLADAPGLGKTLQTIAALDHEKRILILCPASLKYSWKQEVEKWSGKFKTVVVDGDKKMRSIWWASRVCNGTPVQFHIANYELLLYDFEEISKIKWDAIVCDEATRISNPLAKSVKALKRLPAKKRIALTGTPISNSPVDLYSILDWLAPGVLGTYWQFLDTFCVREPRFNRVIGFKNLDKLTEVTKGFMLRRTKEEVLKDLPPKTTEDIIFPLSALERELYDDIRMQIVDKLGDISKNLGIIPVEMLRLKQCTGDVRVLNIDRDISSSKLKALKEILDPIMKQ